MKCDPTSARSSQGAPSAAVMLSELALQSGVPNGVLNAVHGGESTVDLLVTHPGVMGVSWTCDGIGRSLPNDNDTHNPMNALSLTHP